MVGVLKQNWSEDLWGDPALISENIIVVDFVMNCVPSKNNLRSNQQLS